MKSILVIGSLNADLVVKVDKIPTIGETISADELNIIPGGKGANQAVAVGKLEGRVSMAGCVGEDHYGDILINSLEQANVDTIHIKRCAHISTGIAVIAVDKNADNQIIVVSGANKMTDISLVHSLENVIDQSDIIILQLEIPIETVHHLIQYCHERGKLVILNPAPVNSKFKEELFPFIDILVPNEIELRSLTGQETDTLDKVISASKFLVRKGVNALFVTLGEKGSVLVQKDSHYIFQPYKVVSKDTTAAGDSYIGGLATALSKGCSLIEAGQFATKVSALTVTKEGAQTSIPTLAEVEEFYGNE